MLRAVQLKCPYTGTPAPEVDRIRIQAKIDEFQAKVEEAYDKGDHVMISSYRLSILTLQGHCPMPRG